MQQERDDATNRLAGLRIENAQLRSNSNETELLELRAEVTRLRYSTAAKSDNSDTNESTVAEIKFWLANVEKLKEILAQSPDKQIPELQFMSPNGWMFSSEAINQGTDEIYTNAIKLAQGCAKQDFAKSLYEAIQKFMAANNGSFPSDFSQLPPYFDRPVDTAVFQRYEIVQTELDAELISNAVPNVPNGKAIQFVYRPPGFTGPNPKLVEWVVMEKTPLYEGDARIVVSKTGVHLQKF